MELSLHVCGFHKTWKPNDWPNFPHYTIDFLFFFSIFLNEMSSSVNPKLFYADSPWYQMLKSRLYWLQDEEAFVKGRGDLNPLGQTVTSGLLAFIQTI